MGCHDAEGLPGQQNFAPPPTATPPAQNGQPELFAPPPSATPPAQNGQTQLFAPPPSRSPPQQITSYPPPPQQVSAQQRYTPPPQQHYQVPNFSTHDSYHQVSSGGPVVPQPNVAAATYAESSQSGDLGGNYDGVNSETGALDASQSVKLYAGAPPAGQFVGASTTQDDVGTFNGGSYRISHRDSNTIVTIQLAFGCPLTAKPGRLGK